MILLSPCADLVAHIRHLGPVLSRIPATFCLIRVLHPRGDSESPCRTLRTAGPAIEPIYVLASRNVLAFLAGFPRTFLETGYAERFLDMYRTLRDRMARDMGEEQVRYYEMKDAIHDHLIFPFEKPLNRDVLKALEVWLTDGILQTAWNNWCTISLRLASVCGTAGGVRSCCS